MSRLTIGAVIVVACSVVPAAAAQQPRGSQPASQRPTVLVLPVSNDPHDSIRTVLERDFDYGDRLEVVSRDSELLRQLIEGSDPPILRPDSVAQLGARFVVRSARRLDTLRVTVYDTVPGREPETRSYVLPSIPPPRARFVHDSIVRSYELRETAARERLTRFGVMYDSLVRAAQGRQPRNAEQRAMQSAQRDSLFRMIAAEGPQLHAALLRMPTERDSLLAARIPQEVALYDSLVYVQRMALHSAADELQHWLTGVRGAAASRIAFVRRGLLHVIDSDGANERVLTREGRALSPSWHPSGQWIVFSEITDAGTQIAEVEVGTGKVRLFRATPRGYNITPTYTPDGRHIVYAASGTGGSQLVSLNRETLQLTQLAAATRNGSSPTFSPDGSRMALILPRAWSGSGSTARMTPQVFLATSTGARLDQLTPSKFGVRSYRTSPEWSPDGQYVAYTQQGGGFQIWLSSVRDKRARQLTSGDDHEDASWSPDSRHVVLTAGRDATRLLILDIETGRKRELPVKIGSRLPAWSPRWTPEQPVVRPGQSFAVSDDED